MHNKVKDKRYDLTGPIATDEEYLTTEFEYSDVDADSAELYRQYKAVQSVNREEIKDIDAELENYTRSYKAWMKGDATNYKKEKTW